MTSDPAVSPGTDLIILGGGPTGLFAAYYAGLRGLSVNVIDSAPTLGGQLAALYPEKPIYDIPGFPAVRAKELVRRLIRQCMSYNPSVCLAEQASALTREGQGWLIETNKGRHASKAVIISGGVGAIQPRRLPTALAGAFEGRGLSYHLAHPEEYVGRDVLIVGGQDQAVEWANQLAPYTRRQTLVHRRDQFRATPNAVSQMRAGPTVIQTPYELTRVSGSSSVEAATITHTETGESKVISASSVMINTGFVSSLGPLATWGLTLQGSAVLVDSRMQTNLPGVFAAGDICVYPGKLKLLATAFGEAAMAVNHAACYLDPSANPFPGHSTNLPVPPGVSAQ